MKNKALLYLSIFLISGLLPHSVFADSVENALRAVQAVETANRIEKIQNATDPFKVCVSKLYFVQDLEFQEAACNCALDIVVEGCEPYKAYIDFYNGVGPQPPETHRNTPVSGE